MTPQEKREQNAREILAQAFEDDRQHEAASKLRSGVMHGQPFVRAIIAAQDAERERCAGIVEHRLKLIPTLAPVAGYAVLSALPDAIRNPMGEKP